jgi:hypothetical protein
MKAYIKDKYNSNKFIEYTEPIYTKMDMYGYLTLQLNKVLFFWYNEHSGHICHDDVTDKFEVKYEH